MKSKARFVFFALLAVSFTGCGKEEIKVYSVPKETTAAPQIAAATPANAALSATPVPPVNKPLTWKTPAGWEELPPTSMRVGSFVIKADGKKADVSIIPLSGNSGTELENVTRWRGEVGLPPIPEKEIKGEQVAIGSDGRKLFEFDGAKEKTLATSLLKEGTTWFFKMRGDKDIVSASKAQFVEFLKSVSFDADQPSERSETIAENTENKDATESGGERKPGVPSTWKEVPPSPMVLKKFTATDSSGNEAAITVSTAGGDMLANVNRWRGQLSLDPIDASALPGLTSSIDVENGKATLVDMKGTDKTGKPARMIVAMIPQGDKTWFYKMMGEEKVVEREKDAFLKFVKTVRY